MGQQGRRWPTAQTTFSQIALVCFALKTHQRDCQRDVPHDPQFKQHCHKRRVGRRSGRRADNRVGVFRALTRGLAGQMVANWGLRHSQYEAPACVRTEAHKI